MQEQKMFEQKLKAEHDEVNRCKATLIEMEQDRVNSEEREEERRKRQEIEERDREQILRGELLQRETELRQLRLKIDELNQENEEGKEDKIGATRRP